MLSTQSQSIHEESWCGLHLQQIANDPEMGWWFGMPFTPSPLLLLLPSPNPTSMQAVVICFPHTWARNRSVLSLSCSLYAIVQALQIYCRDNVRVHALAVNKTRSARLLGLTTAFKKHSKVSWGFDSTKAAVPRQYRTVFWVALPLSVLHTMGYLLFIVLHMKIHV